MDLAVSLRRLGYRFAFRVLQLRWRLLAPRFSGVKCVITDGSCVLLVRHTYGDRSWDLPGGTSRSGEPPAATASREMAEELGLSDLRWRALGQLRGRMYHRHDAIELLGAAAPGPSLRLNRAEIESAAWFAPDRLPLWRSRQLDPIVAAGVLDADVLAAVRA